MWHKVLTGQGSARDYRWRRPFIIILFPVELAYQLLRGVGEAILVTWETARDEWWREP